jgi:hypothetical protein
MQVARVVVLCIALAARKIEVHDVALVLRFKLGALIGRDDIIGWRDHLRGIRKALGIETKRAKWDDASHGFGTLISRPRKAK